MPEIQYYQENPETEAIELKRKTLPSRFNSQNGWYINWGGFPDDVRVFALALKGTFDIQGLIAIEPDHERKVYILSGRIQNNKWRYAEAAANRTAMSMRARPEVRGYALPTDSVVELAISKIIV